MDWKVVVAAREVHAGMRAARKLRGADSEELLQESSSRRHPARRRDAWLTPRQAHRQGLSI